jgi:hypothetical protein
MAAIAGIFRWLVRQGLIYLLILVALILHFVAWPWIDAQWNGMAETRAEGQAIESTLPTIERMRRDAQTRLEADAAAYRAATLEELRARRAEAVRERAIVTGQLDDTAGFLKDIDPATILERKRLELQRNLLEQRIAALDHAISAAESGMKADAAAAALAALGARPTDAQIRSAVGARQQAERSLRAFKSRWGIDRLARNVFAQEEAKRRSALAHAKARETALRTKRAAYDRAASANAAARKAYADARRWSAGTIGTVSGDLGAAVRSRREAVAGSWRAWIEVRVERWRLSELALTALGMLALVIAMPYLIRALFFYVLAPLAERRADIRIKVPWSHSARPIPLPDNPSRISLPVTLAAGEELLVRQDYLQTTSLEGAKATQWLLDWRHPFSSFAAGLSFLTRIRGEGEVTTVSAVRDPFAEVTELVLPEGATCVLKPRSLIAFVQPTGRPMRVTSHWRLFTLSAWLTMQLRFIAFHGPARLIVKGGRGVRIERAERGRVFGQDQLVGFSADLAYSVARTETFMPYLLGREQLLKDKVKEGSGILVIEEAPLATGRNGEVKKGLEGTFDTMLTALGL